MPLYLVPKPLLAGYYTEILRTFYTVKNIVVLTVNRSYQLNCDPLQIIHKSSRPHFLWVHGRNKPKVERTREKLLSYKPEKMQFNAQLNKLRDGIQFQKPTQHTILKNNRYV